MDTGNDSQTTMQDKCWYCDKVLDDANTVRCVDCGRLMCRDCGEHYSECGCGNTVCEDCLRVCAECGSHMCGDCAYYCEHCESDLCDDCSRWCHNCDERYCMDCAERCDECGDRYCPDCWDEHPCMNTQKPEYRNPYEGLPVTDPYTFGLEIEVDGNHDSDMLKNHRLIAGWCPDGSLHHDGSLEYQSEPMTMSDLTEIQQLIGHITTDTDNRLAGGHMHISRTSRQTANRWYWALAALTESQCVAMNMRHMTDDRWCELRHGEYAGKATAINDSHTRTIEFRTFGPWHCATAEKLGAAVNYMHVIWRFFQKFPIYKLKTRDIQAMSRVTARQAIKDMYAKRAKEARI